MIGWEARDGEPLFIFTPTTLLEAEPDRFREHRPLTQEVWEKPWPGQVPSERRKNKMPKTSGQEPIEDSGAASSSGAGGSPNIIQQLVASTYDNSSDAPYVSSSLQSNFPAAKSSDCRIPKSAKSGDSSSRPKTRSIYIYICVKVVTSVVVVPQFPIIPQHASTTPHHRTRILYHIILPPHCRHIVGIFQVSPPRK